MSSPILANRVLDIGFSYRGLMAMTLAQGCQSKPWPRVSLTLTLASPSGCLMAMTLAGVASARDAQSVLDIDIGLAFRDV